MLTSDAVGASFNWEARRRSRTGEGIVGYQQRSDHEAGALQDCLSAITRTNASEPRADAIPHNRACTGILRPVQGWRFPAVARRSSCWNVRSAAGDDLTGLSAISPYSKVDPVLFIGGSFLRG